MKNNTQFAIKRSPKMTDIMSIILAVDENPQTLLDVRDLLEEPRRMVITQRSGLEVLRLIRIGIHLDAVVASDNLSDMEVFQLLIALKRLAPAVPVIMLLSPGPDAECLKRLSPGIFEYVEKTSMAVDLKRAVDTVVDLASGSVRTGSRRDRSFGMCHGSPQ